MRLASIDIGSNTIRLLVADVVSGKLNPLRHERKVTRLASGLHSSGIISGASLGETLRAVKEFVATAERHDATGVIMAGTSALREAMNSPEAVKEIEDAAGLRLEIITGHQEAEIMAMGVLCGLELKGESLIFDIGGGSTELIALRDGAVLKTATIDAGVVKLTEGALLDDPPSPLDIGNLDKLASRFAKEGAMALGEYARRSSGLIGTAGTATTLASLDMGLEKYDWQRVQGHVIGLERIKELEAMIQALPLQERKKIRGMDPDRADLIIAGTRLTIRIMEALDIRHMTVSDYGLLEGLIIKLSSEPLP